MNYISVIVAAVAAMVVGFIWYSPQLFGKQMLRSIGKSEKDMGKGMGPTVLILAFASALVMAFVLDKFIGYAGAAGLMGSVKIAAMAWLGFAAPLVLAGHLWYGKSKEMTMIDGAHHLVAMVAMGAVLALMGI